MINMQEEHSVWYAEGFVHALSYGRFYRRNPYRVGSRPFNEWEEGFDHGVRKYSEEKI